MKFCMEAVCNAKKWSNLNNEDDHQNEDDLKKEDNLKKIVVASG